MALQFDPHLYGAGTSETLRTSDRLILIAGGVLVFGWTGFLGWGAFRLGQLGGLW